MAGSQNSISFGFELKCDGANAKARYRRYRTRAMNVRKLFVQINNVHWIRGITSLLPHY